MKKKDFASLKSNQEGPRQCDSGTEGGNNKVHENSAISTAFSQFIAMLKEVE